MGTLRSYHRLTLALFSLICASVALVRVAGQLEANHTVDDFSSLVSYSAVEAVTHLDTTGFDVTRLNNRTVAVMNSTVSASISMRMEFTGTALWLFFATTGGRTTTASYTVFLDGVVVLDVGQMPLEAEAVYDAVAYSNTSLHGAHKVTLRINDGGTEHFDYAVFTSDETEPETSIAPAQPSSTETPSASAAMGGKPKTHIAVIAGAVASGVVLLLSTCFAMLLLRRGVHHRPINSTPPQRTPVQTSKESASSAPTATDRDKFMLAGGGTTSSTLPLTVSHLSQHLASRIQRQPLKLEYKPTHEYNEDSLKPDSVIGTSDSDPDAAIQRMLMEQHEIMAQHASGRDEKKTPVMQQPPETQTVGPPAAPSTSLGNWESTSNASGRSDLDHEMSSIAAQMRVLQAQMTQLQVERGGLAQSQDPADDVPPPAYAGI